MSHVCWTRPSLLSRQWVNIWTHLFSGVLIQANVNITTIRRLTRCAVSRSARCERSLCGGGFWIPVQIEAPARRTVLIRVYIYLYRPRYNPSRSSANEAYTEIDPTSAAGPAAIAGVQESAAETARLSAACFPGSIVSGSPFPARGMLLRIQHSFGVRPSIQ